MPKLQHFLIIFSIFIYNTSHAQSWNPVGTTGFSADAANWTSIAIDVSGTPYVAYMDDGLGDKATVMKYNGSDWVIVGSAGFSAGAAAFTSIAIDRSGTLYVAYRDYGNGSKATVMEYNGSSWVTVGSAGFSAGAVDCVTLAIDGSGTPYVGYVDSANGRKATVMKYNGSSWIPVGAVAFTAGAINSTAIALDASGTPYIVFADTDYAKATVMKFSGSSWVIVGSAGFSVSYVNATAIAIDGGGTPYVVYADGGLGNKAVVMKYDGAGWVALGGSGGLSVGAAWWTNIAIDGSGTPYVAYEDSALGSKATVIKYTGSSWVPVGITAFSASVAAYTSLAINGSGTPYIVYRDNGYGSKVTVMDALNIAPVIGADSLCTGTTATLVDTAGSGTWICSNLALATIGSSTGIVTGVSAGAVIISYTASGISSTVRVTINQSPNAATITGLDSLCPGGTITLTDPATPGVWSSTHTAIATITSAGLVAAIASGLDTARYIVSNSCGSDTATFPFVVRPVSECPTEVKNINTTRTNPLTIFPNPNQGAFTLLLSTPTNEPAQITITNILGEKIKEYNIPTNQETTIQLDAPPGMYFLTAVSAEGMQYGKVVVR